jgi:hypothetical protein
MDQRTAPAMASLLKVCAAVQPPPTPMNLGPRGAAPGGEGVNAGPSETRPESRLAGPYETDKVRFELKGSRLQPGTRRAGNCSPRETDTDTGRRATRPPRLPAPRANAWEQRFPGPEPLVKKC